MSAQAELVWDVPCSIGECPVSDDIHEKLWFCDIHGRRLYALHLPTGEKRWWDLPETIGSFCLCKSGLLLLALRSKLVLLDPASGAQRDFCATQPHDPALRLNDGKLGPDGAFWVGSMVEFSPHRPEGVLWRVTPDGRAEECARGYRISNGLAWSPDGRTMFHSDSGADPAHIDAWDFDPATGALSGRRQIATLTRADGLPDGAACAVDGSYLSCGILGGCLNRFAPDGTLMAKIPFPIPTPTMPCFVGETVYVTSLRHGMSESMLRRHPAMGSLFRLHIGIKGAPIGRFDA